MCVSTADLYSIKTICHVGVSSTNGLETEHVPSKLQQLNPLGKQLIQRSKVFQAVYRLGTYTRNVPSHNSLQAFVLFLKDTASYQSYTIRRLDQQQSMLPDSEHYKLRDVKEDALSNKLKYLDVLCFPTLFPSGKFCVSHSRLVAITAGEYAKARLLNKDSRFHTNDQYVFFLLWQRDARNLCRNIQNAQEYTATINVRG